MLCRHDVIVHGTAPDRLRLLAGALNGHASLGPNLLQPLQEARVLCPGRRPDKRLKRRSATKGGLCTLTALRVMSFNVDTPFVLRAARN